MLAVLRNLLGMLPIQWQVGLIAGGLLALAGVVGGAALYLDHQGYQRAATEWSIKYDRRERELDAQRLRELDRQATVNAEARAKEQAQIRALETRVADLDRIAEDLLTEAANDPLAGRVGLDAGAVDRITRGTQP